VSATNQLVCIPQFRPPVCPPEYESTTLANSLPT
jgi:hypothetical protein